MSLSYKQISPEKLARRRHFHIVDIRSEEERRGELGFIPGSLCAPEGEGLDHLLDLFPDEDAVVLTCLGGKRATARIIELLHTGSTRRLYNLEGGMLAWHAASLPVASFLDAGLDRESPQSAEEFFLHMRSCFVGEIVEIIVERDLDLDPLELLHTSSKLATLHHNGTPFEERLINFAGYVSWQIGTPLEHIARNMNWALAHRHFIAHTDPAELTW